MAQYGLRWGAFGESPGDGCTPETFERVTRAVDTRAVALAFQPVVFSAAPAMAAFHEGLVRVVDGDGAVLPARAFIETIEPTDAGRRIDCLALELGLAALAADPFLRLSVNVSPRSVGDPRWLATLESGLVPAPAVAKRLILEFTESAAMERPTMIRSLMGDLKSRGVSFALDDFGAGHTSLNYLRRFAFDILKFDGTFTRNIDRDRDNQVLVGALAEIGRHFDLLMVAERVETASEAQFLTELGIDCQQGYLHGAPVLTGRGSPPATNRLAS